MDPSARKHQRKHSDSFRLRCLHCCERRRSSGSVQPHGAFPNFSKAWRRGFWLWLRAFGLSPQRFRLSLRLARRSADLDAVAVGQFTPGPVLTTATFIGYIVAGLPGAILTTVGIFLPSFVFVAAVFPIVGMLRRSRWASGFLDGVNVGALGRMAGVTWQLGRAAVIDGFTTILARRALVLVFRFKINSACLVLAGGTCGAAYNLLV
jgi:hypothetical protein